MLWYFISLSCVHFKGGYEWNSYQRASLKVQNLEFGEGTIRLFHFVASKTFPHIFRIFNILLKAVKFGTVSWIWIV